MPVCYFYTRGTFGRLVTSRRIAPLWTAITNVMVTEPVSQVYPVTLVIG